MRVTSKIMGGFLIVTLLLVTMGGFQFYTGNEVREANADVNGEVEELVILDKLLDALNSDKVLMAQYALQTEVGRQPGHLDRIEEVDGTISLALEALQDLFIEDGEAEAFVSVLALVEEGIETIEDAWSDIVAEIESGTPDRAVVNSAWDTIVTTKESIEVGTDSVDEQGLDFLHSEVTDEIAKAEERLDAALSLSRTVFWVLIGIAVTATVGGGIVIGRSIARPLATLTEAAARVKAGDLDVNVEPAGDDEVRQLGDAFNRMMLSIRLLADNLEDEDD